jgi:hypothetical protein
VVGISANGNGVWDQTDGAGTGVVGTSKNGVGVHGKGGRLAGLFEGDVEVTGDIRLANADCAEDFAIADADFVEPGTVMVLGDEGALRGKVYCKVDARYAAIEVGDLLTTSASPGHAMKASEPLKAFGAVIGKALSPLQEGQGLIPVLVALQ